MTTPNLAESVNATIAAVEYGRTVIDLDRGAWSALGLGIGDRCMVEVGDDIASAEVTDGQVVTLDLALGQPGRRVRVRRPQLARSS